MTPAVPQPTRLRDGATFVLDSAADVSAVWGHPDEVLWSAGEPLMIAGPSGVGKTTIAQQLVAGRLGLQHSVLDLPIVASDRPVLYLALDRPQQIRRAMRRRFTEEHRQVLADRLVVWDGPLPLDIGQCPDALLEICTQAGAGTIVIDSLKDAAMRLSEDAVGSAINRAVQQVIANGTEVLVLHHQRKEQLGHKPSALADVYGSAWLTAGMGSVLVLWGAAGDSTIDMLHLKQPTGEVGPWRLQHDHTTGVTTRHSEDVDALALLRQAPRGLTTTALAKSMAGGADPTDTHRRAAQRHLDRLVQGGHARKTPADRGGRGGTRSARYHAITDHQEHG